MYQKPRVNVKDGTGRTILYVHTDLGAFFEDRSLKYREALRYSLYSLVDSGTSSK